MQVVSRDIENWFILTWEKFVSVYMKNKYQKVVSKGKIAKTAFLFQKSPVQNFSSLELTSENIFDNSSFCKLLF